MVPPGKPPAPRRLRWRLSGALGRLLFGSALLGGAGVSSGEEPDRPAEARSVDAAAHHGIITPRAQSLSEGQAAVHVQDLALVGVSYGYTDDVQATVIGLLPVDDGLPYAGLFRGKVVVKRGPRAVIATRVDIGAVWPRGNTGIGASYGVGATADLHLDEVDRLVVTVGGSAHAGAGSPVGRDLDPSGTAVLLYEGAGRLRLRGPVHLLGELWVPVVLHDRDVELAPYLVAPVGLRLATRLVSLDAGFILGKAADLEPTDFPIGVPWVAGTVRFE